MPDFARRATDAPHPKWRLLVPIFLLMTAAAGLVLIPRYKTVATTTQVTATVETTDTPTMAAEAPSAKRRPDAVASPAPEKRTTTFTLDMMKERQQYQTQQRQWMAQAAFSFLLAMASVFVILSKKYPEDCNKWAYSTIAFILGYWLKS